MKELLDNRKIIHEPMTVVLNKIPQTVNQKKPSANGN